MTRPAGRPRTGRRPTNAQSGMVLVASMLMMAMLSILALAGIATSTLEVKISAHDRDAKQAFYLCEAGLEKAKYEAIKGWGKGTAGTNGPGDYRFEFAAGTMPDIVKTSFWQTDKWVNFTLADSRGVQCLIAAHTNGSTNYEITQCMAPEELQDGRARLFYRDGGVVAYSDSGTASGSQVTVPSGPGWAPGIWVGLQLRDLGTGTMYEITASDADTLSLSGTPPAGAINFEIWRAVGVAPAGATPAKFRLYADPDTAGVVGAPSQEWIDSDYDFTADYWYLQDQNGALYLITDTEFDTNAAGTGFMELTLDEDTATPAHGSFEIVTNPWLADMSANPPSPWGFFGYGEVQLTVYSSQLPGPFGTLPAGQYVLSTVSTSTTAGNTKEIQMDAELGADSRVMLTDWREVR